MKKEWHKHYGVYGVAYENSKILLINKVKGPYINRFDLPGGGLNEDESIIQHLQREFIEETGYEIEVLESLGIQDFKIKEAYLNYKFIHHIAIFYSVKLKEKVKDISSEINVYGNNEINDSDGISWKNLNELSIENSSPLVMKVLSELKKKFKNKGFPSDLIKYNDWKRKEVQ
ncbi:NUDIX hydrolase [Fusobacteria bacterium ZRK30]|nr:NUDIX hydrolase [Fusobacteria bacterium ZRK30]